MTVPVLPRTAASYPSPAEFAPHSRLPEETPRSSRSCGRAEYDSNSCSETQILPRSPGAGRGNHRLVPASRETEGPQFVGP